jgi:hypothetical protein
LDFCTIPSTLACFRGGRKIILRSQDANKLIGWSFATLPVKQFFPAKRRCLSVHDPENLINVAGVASSVSCSNQEQCPAG